MLIFLGNVSESVLQKFRKSFSLRFYRSGKGGGGGKDEEDEDKDLPPLPPESPPPESRLTPPLTKDDSSERFRFVIVMFLYFSLLSNLYFVFILHCHQIVQIIHPSNIHLPQKGS